jgi:hypothetical protein
MKIAVLTGAVAAALMMSPAQGAVRIKADPGGQIGPYLENLVALRGSGERVIIDGPCLSACTMVLGVIPRERICVTARARLGFHAAWHPGDDGHPVPSREATKLLMDIYPEHVRSWIARRGGLSPHMMFLSGRELTAMYRTCDDPRAEDRRGGPSPSAIQTPVDSSRRAARAQTPPAAERSAIAP